MMQAPALPPKLLSHLIKLWGDAILHLALKQSQQCGSAKNVIKSWLINLMLAAERQNKAASIFSLQMILLCLAANADVTSGRVVSTSLSVRNHQITCCLLNCRIPEQWRWKSQGSQKAKRIRLTGYEKTQTANQCRGDVSHYSQPE